MKRYLGDNVKGHEAYHGKIVIIYVIRDLFCKYWIKWFTQILRVLLFTWHIHALLIVIYLRQIKQLFVSKKKFYISR